MKKMSKLLSGVMALAMIGCMSVTAFAAEGPAAGNTDVGQQDGNGNAEVQVQLAATLPEEEDVYKVNIAWTSMDFVYTGNASVWNADKHERTAASGSWNQNDATITVINHSNKGVSVDNSYEPAEVGKYVSGQAYEGVTLTVNDFGKETLTAGVEGTPEGTDEQDKTTCKVTVTGTPEKAITEAIVGTITVTVAPEVD